MNNVVGSVLIISLLSFAVAIAGWPLIKDLKFQKSSDGKWETHPCKLPTNATFTVSGKVWQCKCGRRWKFIKTDYSQMYPKSIWEERTPEVELAEAEARLREMNDKS